MTTHEDRLRRLAEAEGPILDELGRMGLGVEHIQNLYHDRYDYRGAIRVLTGIFVAEFTSRIVAAHDRRQYLRGHWSFAQSSKRATPRYGATTALDRCSARRMYGSPVHTTFRSSSND